MDELRSQFHRAMVDAYQACVQGVDYHPTLVKRHMGEHGAVETARWLVNLPNESSGFTRLWEAKRIDLSAEAIILQPEFVPLFSVEDRRLAYDTLKAYGYAFPTGVVRP
jgi:hypothetical protein